MSDNYNQQIQRLYNFYKDLYFLYPENVTIKKEYLRLKKLQNKINGDVLNGLRK